MKWLRGGRLAAVLSVMVFAGCQEDLTAPGSCPANCPGGTPALHDTILDAIVGGDSTYAGYFAVGSSAAGLRVSNGLVGDTDYGVIRFLPRADTFLVNDTFRTYTIDSAAIEVSLLAFDSTTSGIRLALHRLPRTVDSTVTFARVDSFVADSTIIDTAIVQDSFKVKHVFRWVFKDSTLSTVDIPAADSGAFALALAISGPTPTGMRYTGVNGQLAAQPVFRTYITVNIADTTSSVKHQTITRAPTFTTWVSSGSPANDPDLLVLGTSRAARAMIRFPWPAYLKDTALLARATLELTPSATVQGLKGDSAFLQVFGIRADFGAKSPGSGAVQRQALVFGSVDTVRVDVIADVQRWQFRTLPDAPALFLNMSPEGASFTEPQFYSTRATAPRRPRLHITYQLPYDFERP